MDVINGYFWDIAKDKIKYAKQLHDTIQTRRIKIPIPGLIMIGFNIKYSEISILEWLIDHTADRVYLSAKRIGFLNEKDAVIFQLKFG